MSHWVKFARAHEHLAAIEKAVGQFLKMKPHSLTGQYDPARPYNVGQEGRFILRVHAPAQPPAFLPELIGDYLTNLRATLDHLIFAIATKHTGGHFHSRFKIQFGIYEQGSDFSAFRGRVQNDLPPEVLTDMERLQPYKGCNDPKLLRKFIERQPLWILNALVNEDKHRGLVTVPLVSIQSMAITLVHAHPIDSPDSWRTSGSYKHGAEVLSIRFIAEGSNARVDVHPDFATDVAFTEEWPAVGRPVIETLQMLSNHVRDNIFPILEQHL